MNNIRPIAWKKYPADRINARTNHIFIILMAAILLIALGAGVVDAQNRTAPASKPGLSNVRDYAAAVDHKSYAIDGGVLFAGGPNGWVEVPMPNALYRAENYGLSWFRVENLGSPPTALAIADSNPATIYVGTVDRGLVKSQDGLTWTTANEGLGFVPGSRLQVDALAVDPQQPGVLYVATSYLYGSAELHQSPVGVAMSIDGAQSWSLLHEERNVAVAGLLPVSGETGAVYAVSNVSRTPLALGKAPALAAQATETAAGEANPAPSLTSILAWVVAALATLALVLSIALDLRQRRLATMNSLAHHT